MDKKNTKPWYTRLPHVLIHFFSEEFGRQSLSKTLLKSIGNRELTFYENETLSGLLERQSHFNPSKPFIYYENECLTFSDVNQIVNRYANYLDSLGLLENDGLGVMMENCPEFLYSYYASQRLGMYFVPINTGLVSDGLFHLLNHSDIKYLIIDDKYLSCLKPLRKKLGKIKKIFVRPTKPSSPKLSPPYYSLKEFVAAPTVRKPNWFPRAKNMSMILYTSGTTGQPKGVVLYYDSSWVRRIGLINHLIYQKSDVIYTCLPLFHANALIISFSAALWLGIPIVLSKRFSASSFWQEIKKYKVTIFNSIGAMIPILLKNPKRSSDKNNPVRLTLSAGCPSDSWKEFEKRFNIKIWESYSAVDGGQNYTFNMGNAPVGSVGKPLFTRYRIVDEKGDDCLAQQTGELIFKQKKKSRTVVYYKDKKAIQQKIKNGYIHTGDLVYRDSKGNLYFVGRKTDSMRRKGENVSAHEIESIILKHPDILECAAFGIPSELGEDEIVCAIVPVKGKKVNPSDLKKWLSGKLAYHATPRYIRILDMLPKTPNQKIIKKELIESGVTADCYDLEDSKYNRSKGTQK